MGGAVNGLRARTVTGVDGLASLATVGLFGVPELEGKGRNALRQP